MDLGRPQKEVAKILEIGAWNLRHWDTGRYGGQNWCYQKVIHLLGYNFFRPPCGHGRAALKAAIIHATRRARTNPPRTGLAPPSRVIVFT